MKLFKTDNGIRDFIFFIALVAITHTIMQRNGNLYEKQLQQLYAKEEATQEISDFIRHGFKEIETIKEFLPAAVMDDTVAHTLATITQSLQQLQDEANTLPVDKALLEKKLLAVFNTIGSLIATLQPHHMGETLAPSFTPAESLEDALAQNSHTLNTVKK